MFPRYAGILDDSTGRVVYYDHRLVALRGKKKSENEVKGRRKEEEGWREEGRRRGRERREG